MKPSRISLPSTRSPLVMLPKSRHSAKKAGGMAKSGFASPIKDFYLTNPIARASAVMAECSALARNNFQAAAE